MVLLLWKLSVVSSVFPLSQRYKLVGPWVLSTESLPSVLTSNPWEDQCFGKQGSPYLPHHPRPIASYPCCRGRWLGLWFSVLELKSHLTLELPSCTRVRLPKFLWCIHIISSKRKRHEKHCVHRKMCSKLPKYNLPKGFWNIIWHLLFNELIKPPTVRKLPGVYEVSTLWIWSFKSLEIHPSILLPNPNWSLSSTTPWETLTEACGKPDMPCL